MNDSRNGQHWSEIQCHTPLRIIHNEKTWRCNGNTWLTCVFLGLLSNSSSVTFLENVYIPRIYYYQNNQCLVEYQNILIPVPSEADSYTLQDRYNISNQFPQPPPSQCLWKLMVSWQSIGLCHSPTVQVHVYTIHILHIYSVESLNSMGTVQLQRIVLYINTNYCTYLKSKCS